MLYKKWENLQASFFFWVLVASNLTENSGLSLFLNNDNFADKVVEHLKKFIKPSEFSQLHIDLRREKSFELNDILRKFESKQMVLEDFNGSIQHKFDVVNLYVSEENLVRFFKKSLKY